MEEHHGKLVLNKEKRLFCHLFVEGELKLNTYSKDSHNFKIKSFKC